ncbi:DUF4386 domain-containing protein [Kordia sp. YSTF-M3]|uniref:DUF4386 domain-containing protein n=1 Tax=Kordia aestuariivivens TaxID=2759037 RepID=A0ABR7Q6M9_9FLAO|nr:DUF4386 domain-containing protein [Kordia aestuariivivens]MBC8754103.1 DUF4386 domain-containing protein [Kordia aestuariivivens]
MNIIIIDKKQHKIAKIMGIMFLLTLVVPLINWMFVLQKFIIPENVLATANNIITNELLFRVNIINELITAFIVIGLAIALYSMLKSVNKNLALLALYLKLTEATIWIIITLGHFIGLLILKEQVTLTLFEPEQLQSIIGFFLNMHLSITAIPGILHGLSLVIFLYLLFKSKYVPSALAAFGVISFALVFIYDLLFILSPGYTTLLIIQLIGWGPSILFELIIGIWLLFKGINESGSVSEHVKADP